MMDGLITLLVVSTSVAVPLGCFLFVVSTLVAVPLGMADGLYGRDPEPSNRLAWISRRLPQYRIAYWLTKPF